MAQAYEILLRPDGAPLVHVRLGDGTPYTADFRYPLGGPRKDAIRDALLAEIASVVATLFAAAGAHAEALYAIKDAPDPYPEPEAPVEG